MTSYLAPLDASLGVEVVRSACRSGEGSTPFSARTWVATPPPLASSVERSPLTSTVALSIHRLARARGMSRAAEPGGWEERRKRSPSKRSSEVSRSSCGCGWETSSIGASVCGVRSGAVELRPLEGRASDRGARRGGRFAVVDPGAVRAQHGLHRQSHSCAGGEPAQRASQLGGCGQRREQGGREERHQRRPRRTPAPRRARSPSPSRRSRAVPRVPAPGVLPAASARARTKRSPRAAAARGPAAAPPTCAHWLPPR